MQLNFFLPSVRSWTLGPERASSFGEKNFARPPAAGSRPPAASVRPPPTRQLGRPALPPFRPPPALHCCPPRAGSSPGRSARALPRGRRRPQPGLLGGKALAAGRPVARPLRKAPAPSRQRAQAPSSQRCLVAAGRPCSAPGDYRRCHGEARMPLP